MVKASSSQALQRPAGKMKRPAASVMKKPAAAKPATKGKAKPAAAVCPPSTSEEDEYAPIPFPERYLDMPVPDEFPGFLTEVSFDHSPSQEACEEAPNGWLRDWDFLTIEQRVYILHHPENGIFPFAEGIVRFANPDVPIALPDGSLN